MNDTAGTTQPADHSGNNHPLVPVCSTYGGCSLPTPAESAVTPVFNGAGREHGDPGTVPARAE